MRKPGWALFVWLCFAAVHGDASADEGVYRRTDAEGRTVYTNIGNVALDGAALEALNLPALTRMDMSAFAPEELSRVDAHIEQVHTNVQAGPRCDAIRRAARASLRSILLHEHRRELSVSAVLFAFSLLVGFAFRSRALRTVLPIAPFVGSMYLGFVAAERAQAAVSEVHTGLRACSAELPETHPRDPSQTKKRLESALDLKADIDRVFERRERMMEGAIARSLQ